MRYLFAYCTNVDLKNALANDSTCPLDGVEWPPLAVSRRCACPLMADSGHSQRKEETDLFSAKEPFSRLMKAL